ncbi:MAG: chemotaxis protein CheA [Magnetococcales bacterium]|nr:chemotaxis protein CheA [Magnetococcales bacterium]
MFDEATQLALMQEFFSENREALDRIERGLLQLESTPTNRELLNSVFRDMHTVKGNCRMMGFERLEELTHTAESLLDRLRDGKLMIDTRIGNELLGVVDTVRRTLVTIEQSGSEGEVDFSTLIQQLEQVQAAETRIAPSIALEEPSLPELSHGDSPTTPDSTATRGDHEGNPGRIDSIRLSIERLDALMSQVGELGAVFNQLKYAVQRNPAQTDQALEGLGQQIHALQEEVLQYRLQPIGRILDNYHRLVRDLAVETKKKVILDLTGEETEVDRNVLIAIKEVLGHLIRNAIDHGIEPPEERMARGKSPVGRVRLSAEQKQGQIYLEIADDGRGIDVSRVRDKAIERGLINLDLALEMPDSEVMKLIMAPGFSTAEQVSRISGRGTGMDVVQAAIDKLGGSVTITSQFGAGSRFRLRIPQTMAIVSVLLVTACGETYAIPQVNIVELVSFHGAEVADNVEGKLQSPMVRVRERIFPLISLRQLVTHPDHAAAVTRSVEEIRSTHSLHVVVLQSEERIFGLDVDAIKEPASLVIKPVNRIFSDISLLAGTAVMPDGSVSFLLNVPELIKL